MQKNPKPQNWQPIRYSMCLELCRAISLSHLQIQIKIHESFVARSATRRRIRACNSPANTPKTGLSPAPHQTRQQLLMLSSTYPLVRRGVEKSLPKARVQVLYTQLPPHISFQKENLRIFSFTVQHLKDGPKTISVHSTIKDRTQGLEVFFFPHDFGRLRSLMQFKTTLVAQK